MQRQLSLGEAIKICFSKKYCDFTGRASRSEFWWWVLFTYVLSTALGIIMGLSEDNIAISLIGCIVCLALILPSWAVSVRRLHDIGKSGWNLLIGIIPFIGAIILLIWDVKESEPQPNKYGVVPYTD